MGEKIETHRRDKEKEKNDGDVMAPKSVMAHRSSTIIGTDYYSAAAATYTTTATTTATTAATAAAGEKEGEVNAKEH